jgi:hypothetical protein
MNRRRGGRTNNKKQVLGRCAAIEGASDMRTFFYVFAFSYAGLFLFMIVSWFETNRPLPYLLMVLIVGVTAAAIVKELTPETHSRLMSNSDRLIHSISTFYP